MPKRDFISLCNQKDQGLHGFRHGWILVCFHLLDLFSSLRPSFFGSVWCFPSSPLAAPTGRECLFSKSSNNITANLIDSDLWLGWVSTVFDPITVVSSLWCSDWPRLVTCHGGGLSLLWAMMIESGIVELPRPSYRKEKQQCPFPLFLLEIMCKF